MGKSSWIPSHTQGLFPLVAGCDVSWLLQELDDVDIWERNKEFISKRTNIGEHFTRDVIQSIVFIFLPLGERVHLTNPVYYY